MTHYPASRVVHKIRCCDLRKGDVFEMYGFNYKVMGVSETVITFNPVCGNHPQKMGANSQRLVLLIKRGNIII